MCVLLGNGFCLNSVYLLIILALPFPQTFLIWLFPPLTSKYCCEHATLAGKYVQLLPSSGEILMERLM